MWITLLYIKLKNLMCCNYSLYADKFVLSIPISICKVNLYNFLHMPICISVLLEEPHCLKQVSL